MVYTSTCPICSRHIRLAGIAVGYLALTIASGLGLDISGIVLGTNGLPSRGATVAVSSQTTPNFSTVGRTDGAGQFVFHGLVEDTYSIVVLPPIDRDSQTPIHAPVVVGSNSTNIVISRFLRRLPLAARLLSNGSGPPIAVQISLTPSAPHLAGLSVLMSGTMDGPRDPDETGLYRFDDIICGEPYALQIFMDGKALPSFLVTVDDAGKVTVDEYGLAVLRNHALRLHFVEMGGGGVPPN